MGYKVVFRDHSLYEFTDVGSIHMNKVLYFSLADIDQTICVSHTSKENTVLRSGLSLAKVFMIPNVVDTAIFKPTSVQPSTDIITIVIISRLVYRKCADLLVEVIPEVCHLYPNVLLDDMVVLAEPDPDDIVRAIEKAISILQVLIPKKSTIEEYFFNHEEIFFLLGGDFYFWKQIQAYQYDHVNSSISHLN